MQSRYLIRLKVTVMNSFTKLRYLWVICFLLGFSFGNAQARKEKFYSDLLKDDRIVTVSLPASYKTQTQKKYPLVIILDGEYLFEPFNGALQYGAYWNDLPECVVVAIHMNMTKDQRQLDFYMDAQTGLPDERGVDFFDFIYKEFVPFLDSKYRLTPFRILVGHGLSATFSNLFLYREDPLFNAFIIMSAEPATNMSENLAQIMKTTKRKIYYYQSVAENDPKDIIAQAQNLYAALQTDQKIEVLYQMQVIPDATHYSGVLFAIPQALAHIFSIYQPINATEFQDVILKIDKGFADYLSKKYEAIDKSFSLKIPIRYLDFKAMEEAIIQLEKFDEFVALSDLAKKQYPKSLLSDYYLAIMNDLKGDYRKAQKFYLAAFQKESIGDITKDMVFERNEAIKNLANTN